MPTDEREEHSNSSTVTAEERLSALLAALGELRGYLDERGTHTYELAQRFIANARRDPSTRAYDERQATMLEYQHYIWREIAGRVGQLISLYGEPAPDAASDEAPTPGATRAEAGQTGENVGSTDEA